MKRQPTFLSLIMMFACAALAHAEDIPFGGNAYLTSGANEPGRGSDLRWDTPEKVLSLFFRMDRPADLQLALRASVPEGTSTIRATVAGKTLTAELTAAALALFPLGTFRGEQVGYVRVDLQGISKTGPLYAEVSDLVVDSKTPGLMLAFVRDNESNRFYWGRRGPSVHLSFRPPAGLDIEWFYNELLIPEGKDPVGSYFMANGFGEGYFGVQVNSPRERRILFSVWSPFRTDNPREIPADERIVMLAKGAGVATGEFGNEGSGGQSYFVFPWKAGTTYRFLNRARPDGSGNTIYTAWFYAPEAKAWQLIASFRRPKTNKHLTGLHSFLENFNDRNGWLEREGRYGNQWARDIGGTWHALHDARFTGDDIARRGYRLDYAGGTSETDFFLRNGGFFASLVPLDSRFTRLPNHRAKPDVDLKKLDGVVIDDRLMR